MATQQHTKQGEANKISNEKSFSHKKSTNRSRVWLLYKQTSRETVRLPYNDVSDLIT